MSVELASKQEKQLQQQQQVPFSELEPEQQQQQQQPALHDPAASSRIYMRRDLDGFLRAGLLDQDQYEGLIIALEHPDCNLADMYAEYKQRTAAEHFGLALNE